MTDIASVVDYDSEVAVEIRNPIGKRDKMGLTIWVRHVDCDAALQAVRRADTLDNLAALTDQKGGPTDRTVLMVAACVSRWDWGANTFDGETPDCTLENAIKVLTRAKWMVPQLLPKASDLANFTGKPKTP